MRVSGSIACAAVTILAGCQSQAIGAPGAQVHIPYWQATHSAREACGGSRLGEAQCDVLIENGVHSTYAGWSARDLQKAYDLPITKGRGQSVYIVDAYDNPDVKGDFAAYRKGMGLPAGTLNKYNQDGQTSNYPQGSPNWGVEIDLDVEMASAGCPKCTIDLVEANSNQWSDIGAAEEEAVTLGGTIVSNSYSGSGASESDYDTKGVTYLASAGDDGGGVYEPAAFDRVISVGGTFLNTDSSSKRGYSEVVWPDTGGGCSTQPKPKWQKDPDCKYRTANDIAAVAVNVAEYDSYDEGGWITVDGTSISSPLVAGMVGLAGNSTKQDGGKMLWTLSLAEQKKYLYSVGEGDDGQCHDYLCGCGTKWLGRYCGPAGWGSPHGVRAL
ncbi:MAG TPA: S8 family serine peptidase [Candidatus Cybelea sp.]|nr:S8 family serine peptidase [Candidatus Cybelea sp.]